MSNVSLIEKLESLKCNGSDANFNFVKGLSPLTYHDQAIDQCLIIIRQHESNFTSSQKSKICEEQNIGEEIFRKSIIDLLSPVKDYPWTGKWRVHKTLELCHHEAQQHDYLTLINDRDFVRFATHYAHGECDLIQLAKAAVAAMNTVSGVSVPEDRGEVRHNQAPDVEVPSLSTSTLIGSSSNE